MILNLIQLSVRHNEGALKIKRCTRHLIYLAFLEKFPKGESGVGIVK